MTKIKCVIAAGGLGTRLLGFRDNDKTKMILEVNGSPMINRQIDQLIGWGLNNFVIITNPEFCDLTKKVVKDKFPDINFEYAIQEKPKGISHALLQAKQYLNDVDITVFVLGDNFFEKNPLQGVQIESDNFTLYGDTIKIFFDKDLYDIQIIDAVGNVRLDSIEYNMKASGDYLLFKVIPEDIFIKGKDSVLITEDVEMYSDGEINVKNVNGNFLIKGPNSSLKAETLYIEGYDIDGIFQNTINGKEFKSSTLGGCIFMRKMDQISLKKEEN